MFFKKKKQEKLEEAPLGYWERDSYMIVIPENQNLNPLVGLFERVADIDGVKIIEQKELGIEPGYIKLKYEGNTYEVGFYPLKYELQNSYLTTAFHIDESTIEKLKNATRALAIYMGFNNNAKKSFHLQLKIAEAIIPDMLAVLDESAERMLPAKWVHMAVESKILPSANDLYLVHAVLDKTGEVWLHTHGLCRCGKKEVEILKSSKENYGSHYNLISAYANYIIDKVDEMDEDEPTEQIGVLIDGTPVVATSIPWIEGLKEYDDLKVGGPKDRQGTHNSKSNIIFLYKNEEDEKNKVYSKINIYDELWANNPVFYMSNEETARMKELAIERFDIVKEQFKNKDNQILIKIGLPTGENNKDSLEHIWFELLEFKKDKFKARLTQEPYDIKGIHEGDERWFTKEDITDWVIYTKDFPVTPGSAYRLK